MSPALPGGITCLQRDWLNANHVLLTGPAGQVLIDAGYVTHVDGTLARVARALDGRPLDRLINTHGHADHIGGNAAVRRAFGCPIHVPEGEAAAFAAWDTRALWLDWAGQRAERFTFDAVIRDGDTFAAGSHEWQAVAAPGHDDGTLMFWCAAERVLVSGDALWQKGFGLVLPGTGSDARLDRAAEALDRIEALAPRVVIPGHGAPFTDVGAALERSRTRLAQLRADPVRAAIQAARGMFAFALLDRRALPLDTLPGYFAGLGFYAECVMPVSGDTPAALAARLVDSLVTASAARVRDGQVETTSPPVD